MSTQSNAMTNERLTSHKNLAPFLGVIEQIPEEIRLYAPSWSWRYAKRLEKEEKIIRLNSSARWGREKFCTRRPKNDASLLAYSTDKRGRIVRGWFAKPHDIDIYALNDKITCPIEAVIMDFIAPRLPGFPAHLIFPPEYKTLVDRLRAVWEEHYGLGEFTIRTNG